MGDPALKSVLHDSGYLLDNLVAPVVHVVVTLLWLDLSQGLRHVHGLGAQRQHLPDERGAGSGQRQHQHRSLVWWTFEVFVVKARLRQRMRSK